MPRVKITEGAAKGLSKCQAFLMNKNPLAMKRAGQIIKQHLSMLSDAPEIGRPLDEDSQLRELLIPFGDSGYVALYHYDQASNDVLVLAFRHQKEAGY